MLAVNLSQNAILADKCNIACNFISRSIGLLGRRELNTGEGLLIAPCASIHTFFMRFTIDAVFLDPANCVIRVVSELKPYRIAAVWHTGNVSVLELPAGKLRETATRVGDQIDFQT